MSIVAFRRAALAIPRSVRMYSGELGSSTPPSGTADAMNKREKAQEDLYVRQHDAEKLKALKAEIAAKEKEVAELKKAASDISKN